MTLGKKAVPFQWDLLLSGISLRMGVGEENSPRLLHLLGSRISLIHHS